MASTSISAASQVSRQVITSSDQNEASPCRAVLRSVPCHCCAVFPLDQLSGAPVLMEKRGFQAAQVKALVNR